MTTTSEHTGTPRYLAPELVASDTTVYPTLSSDVYALGCLGLEFIYLQKPHTKHANNLRGQIFQELRKGVPPAHEVPARDWPLGRVWPIIVECWALDPLLRPSALATAYALKRTAFTLPPTVLERIVAFFHWIPEHPHTSQLRIHWFKHTDHLRNLCLTSKSFRRYATPLLYHCVLLFFATNPLALPALMDSLDESHRGTPAYNGVPEGHGRHVEVLIICVSDWLGTSNIPADLPGGLRDLIQRMPRLRIALISPNMGPPVIQDALRMEGIPFLPTLLQIS